ncbi:MAG: ISAs1 family transposase [Candidatus Thioglobus sp.]
MTSGKKPAFLYHFDDLKDPRIDRQKLYPLPEVLLIVLSGSICGAQSWRDFVYFGDEKLDYLRRFLPFANGIPSKNTFARVLSALDPAVFKTCFISWIHSFQLAVKEVIAIDGKCLRKSFDKASGQSAFHMVSAFATSTKLVLGQEKVAEKSNEITAIPKLLDLLNIKGAIISIDAMGTQKKIAKKIRDKKADYVLSLKGNHSKLHNDIKLHFSSEIEKCKTEKSSRSFDIFKQENKGHGRIEKRTCYVTDKIEWLERRGQWCDLKTIAMVESVVTRGDKTSTEKRFFISSLAPNAKEIAEAIRSHWAIENSLHWVLDVTMGEDNSRVRKDNAPVNMAMVRHIVLNLLRGSKVKFRKDMSLKALQKKAGWGESTLDTILMQEF